MIVRPDPYTWTSMFAGPFMDADEVQRDSFHRTCYELTREAIVNWLSEVVPEPAVPPEPDDQIDSGSHSA
jgi:hypothetical protein